MPLFERLANNLKTALGMGGEFDNTDSTDNGSIIKQMRRVSETMWDTDGDKEYEIEYSFMIFTDFVQAKSHAAKADLLLVCSPNVHEPWKVNPEGKPYRGRAGFRAWGAVQGKGKDGRIYKKGKYRKIPLCLPCGILRRSYLSLRRRLGRNYGKLRLGCCLPQSLRGDARGKILKAALDNAAATYTEKYTERTNG